MREQQPWPQRGVDAHRGQRRGRGDETVHQHRNAALGGGDHGRGQRGDLQSADAAQGFAAGVGSGGDRFAVQGQCACGHGLLVGDARRIQAGARTHQVRQGQWPEYRRQRAGRGGVADAHLAEQQQVRAVAASGFDRAPAGVENRIEVGRRHRRTGAEIVGATARLVAGHAGERRVGQAAHIPDMQRQPQFARQHGDGGATRGEVAQHLHRHFRRIRRYALHGDAMIAGEHQHRHPRGLRLLASLQRSQLDGEGFQAPQRALRFGQLPLAGDGMLPVRLRRRRAGPGEPCFCHVCSDTALQSRIVGRGPLPRCAAQGANPALPTRHRLRRAATRAMA